MSVIHARSLVPSGLPVRVSNFSVHRTELALLLRPMTAAFGVGPLGPMDYHLISTAE